MQMLQTEVNAFQPSYPHRTANIPAKQTVICDQHDEFDSFNEQLGAAASLLPNPNSI
jgi:hypothetical protein